MNPFGDTTNGCLRIRAELRNRDGQFWDAPFEFGINYTPEGERGVVVSLYDEFIESTIEESLDDGVELLGFSITARVDPLRPELEFDHDAAERAEYEMDMF